MVRARTYPDAATTDQRLLRGARSRQAIARHSVDVASVEGLDRLSLGRLATDIGLSKSGIQTLFGTKEALQLAAIAAAHEAFVDAVVRPASSAPPGAARVRALVDHWIAYAQGPLFPGGCFWAATLPEFDSRPGPVRDALQRQREDWVGLLGEELRNAEIPDQDAALAAFQIDAVLTATNTSLRLGESAAVDKARLIVDGLLASSR